MPEGPTPGASIGDQMVRQNQTTPFGVRGKADPSRPPQAQPQVNLKPTSGEPQVSVHTVGKISTWTSSSMASVAARICPW